MRETFEVPCSLTVACARRLVYVCMYVCVSAIHPRQGPLTERFAQGEPGPWGERVVMFPCVG